MYSIEAGNKQRIFSSTQTFAIQLNKQKVVMQNYCERYYKEVY